MPAPDAHRHRETDDALLLQTHGFEGLCVIEICANAQHPASAKVIGDSDWRIDLDTARSATSFSATSSRVIWRPG
jgi:hypothetical protein